jgi:hypothetical protein
MEERQVRGERLKRDPKFRSDRQEFIKKYPDYPHGVWTTDLKKDLDRFITRWGIAPIDPESSEYDRNPRYYYQQVGKDGAYLIRVYPWTGEKEVVDEFRRIRKSLQKEKPPPADDETVKKVIDLVNRGEDFEDIGRLVFGEDLDEQGREELQIDQRFHQLKSLFLSEEFKGEEAVEKALEKLKDEEIYKDLKRPYNPGERTRALEKKARMIYDLLLSGLE